MDTKSKNSQAQYQGYLHTPMLWKNTMFGLKQIEFTTERETVFNESIPENLRLGKRVERFVSSELQQNKDIEVLLENVQVQNEKITVGEIDCILKQGNTNIHLEIIYKFYLFDERVGTTEIEHWIGPNRNDDLLKKLTKLKEKQLPLLYNPLTKPLLDSINLKVNEVQQAVCFKAQLFVPYQKEVEFNVLNKDCVNGFYVRTSEIKQFTDCKFYIPSKINWLLEVHPQVKWLNFKLFSEKVETITNEKTSPLCWIKFPNGTIQKFFVVWWS
jgi:hypothetical protein